MCKETRAPMTGLAYLGIFIGYVFLIIGITMTISIFLACFWAMFVHNYDKTFED